jgi:hypothetical protein
MEECPIILRNISPSLSVYVCVCHSLSDTLLTLLYALLCSSALHLGACNNIFLPPLDVDTLSVCSAGQLQRQVRRSKHFIL